MNVLAAELSWLGGAAWLAVGLLGLVEGAGPSGTAGPEVRLHLTLDRDRFVAGEDLVPALTVQNVGDAPVEVPDPFHAASWQPRYRLTGPEHPDGHEFSFRSARGRPPPEAGEEPPTVTLDPGEAVEGGVLLHEWAPVTEPGRYTLSARLEHGGVRAEAEPVSFTITGPEVGSAALSLDPAMGGETASPVFHWVDASTGTLFEGYFDLVAPVITVDPRPRGWPAGNEPFREVEPGAEVLPVRADHDRGAKMTRWRAWRADATLRATPTPFTDPAAAELTGDPEVVRPALATADGTLDVFAVSRADGEPRLALVRFGVVGDAEDFEGAAAEVLWRSGLPAAPVATAAALGSPSGEGPEGDAPPRHVFLFSPAPSGPDDGSEVRHLVVSPDGEREGWARTELPGATLLPGGAAAAARPDGGVEASALARADGGLVLLRARPGSGVERTPLMELPGSVEEAALAYDVAGKGPAWVVLLESGRVVTSLRGEPQELDRRPVRPLEPLHWNGLLYLLTVDPERGPKLDEPRRGRRPSLP